MWFFFFITKKQFDKRQYYFNRVSNDKFAQLFSLQFMDLNMSALTALAATFLPL